MALPDVTDKIGSEKCGKMQEKQYLKAQTRLAGIAETFIIGHVGRREVSLCNNVRSYQIADLLGEAKLRKVSCAQSLVSLTPHGSMFGHHRLRRVFR